MPNSHPEETVIGRAIRHVRIAEGLKLSGVSRKVPVSTLNAIETGRMVPSLAVVDAISDGLGRSNGLFDLPLLASIRTAKDRERLVERLQRRDASLPWIIGALEIALNDHNHLRLQQLHIRWCLSQVLVEQGSWRIAADVLAMAADDPGLRRASYRRDVWKLLGKSLLHDGAPQQAVVPLLKVTGLLPHDETWEVTTANLALAWWQLGQYREASHEWATLVDSSRSPRRRAHALLGLGNVAFRNRRWAEAVHNYRLTLVELGQYSASPDDYLRTYNNLLACYLHLEAPQAVRQIIDWGAAIVGAKADVVGEFLATQAEWAWGNGDGSTARRLVADAKRELGSTIKASWFTVRLVELKIGLPTARRQALLEEILTALSTVADERWALGIRVALAQLAWETGYGCEGIAHLCRLAETLPVIG